MEEQTSDIKCISFFIILLYLLSNIGFSWTFFVLCWFKKQMQCHLQRVTPTPLLSRIPGASRNTRDLPDRVSDASPVGQPRLRGQPIGALREVRQSSHRSLTQAWASCAPQRAIAPAPTTDISTDSPICTHHSLWYALVLHRKRWCGRVRHEGGGGGGDEEAANGS